MFSEYEKYLQKINADLESNFKEQEPFIVCKKGCSYCCSLGQYPLSELEFKYLMSGFEKLDDSTKKIIKNRIKKLKQEYKKSGAKSGKNGFEYSCPFLIGSACSNYEYRPMICRTFGLIKSARTADGCDALLLPDCIHKGLNYANVYDRENNSFDEAKIKNVSAFVEPEAYDISLGSLLEEGKKQGIDFGNAKPMIEFLGGE